MELRQLVRRFVTSERGGFGTSDGRGVGYAGGRLDRDKLTQAEQAPLHYDAYSKINTHILLSGRCQADVRQLSGSRYGVARACLTPPEPQ